MGVNRREFIKGTTALGTAFIVGFHLQTKGMAAKLEKNNPLEPNAFIKIDKNNTITFILGQVEMGQGTYSTIAMCIADELDAHWEGIIFEPAPVKEVYNMPGMGMMLTGGSYSIRNQQDRVRKVGATLRYMLKQAAAKKWQVRVYDIDTKDSYVINKRTKEKLTYGSLIEDIKNMKLPNDIALKKENEYTLIGKPMKRHPIEVEEKLTGKGIFGIDVRLPNMKYASLIFPKVYGAKIKSFDASQAEKLDGIVKIKQLPNNKIAVIANHWWQAKNARDLVKVQWDNGEFEKVSTANLIKEYKEYFDTDIPVMRKDGNTNNAFKTAHKIVEAEYSFPFLAHAPMEPLNCTISHTGDSAYMSVGGQLQTLYRGTAAKILGIEADSIEYYTNYLGGSFGRRSTPNSDFIIDAAFVSKDEGYPIMTLYSREDEIQSGGSYRPMTLANAKLSIDEKGNITALKTNLVNQSLTRGTPFEAFMLKDGVDALQREGLDDHPYTVASHDMKSFCPQSPVTVDWLRSVGHTVSAPIIENIMDEAAFAADIDPLDFRVKNIKNPRFIKLLKNVAKQSDWYNRKKGSGYGVAIAESFGSIVAFVIKVNVKDKDYKVDKVWGAVDCGFAFNPYNVENQMISAINFTIGLTKYSEITITSGKVDQSNFYDYIVSRQEDAPSLIDIDIINSGEKIGGIGEPGVPPMFAAIINALYDATGKRYTDFPIKIG